MKKIFILPILLGPCMASAESISIFYDASGQCDSWCNIAYSGNGCCPAASQVNAENLRQKIDQELKLRDQDFNGFITSNDIEVMDTSGNFVLTAETARTNSMGALNGRVQTNTATVKCKSGFKKNSHDTCVDDNSTYVDDNGFVLDPDEVVFDRALDCKPIRDFQVRFHPVPTKERNNLPDPVYGYFNELFHPEVLWPSGINAVNQFANNIPYPFDPAKDSRFASLTNAVPLVCEEKDGCITLYHCGDVSKWGSGNIGWYDNPNCTGTKITEIAGQNVPDIDGYTLRGYYGYTFNYADYQHLDDSDMPFLVIIPDIVTEQTTRYGATYAKRFVYNTNTQKIPLGGANLNVKKCGKQFKGGHIPDDTINDIVVDVFGGWARSCENDPGLHRTCTLNVQQTTSGAYDAGDVIYNNVCESGYHMADGFAGNEYNVSCVPDDQTSINYTYKYSVIQPSGQIVATTVCGDSVSSSCVLNTNIQLPDITCSPSDRYKVNKWYTSGTNGGYHDAGATISCSVNELGGYDASISGLVCDCDYGQEYCSTQTGTAGRCQSICGIDCSDGSPRDLTPAFVIDEDVTPVP